MSKIDFPTLVAIASAFDSGACRIVPMPEARCDECTYMDMPHECGHCYMFMDPPDDGLCGAYEPKRMSMEWK